VTQAIRNIFAMTPLPLELDYVSAPRRLPWPGLAVLAVALVTAVALAWHYRDVQGKLAFLQASLGLQGAARPPRQENTARLESEERQLGLVVRQLTLPWAQMVDALERASGGDVAMLQLQPDVQQRVLRVTAEAKDTQAMIDYLRRLGESKAFTDVHLVSHRIQADEPTHPVQFVAQGLFGAAP